MNEVMKINRVEEQDNSIESLNNRQTSLSPVEASEEAALTKVIMEKEAERQRLNKANQRLRKKSNHIKQSRTWKLTAPLRILSRIGESIRMRSQGTKSTKIMRQLENEKLSLKTENQTLREDLRLKQEKMAYLAMESAIIDDKYMHDLTKDAKENGEIINYIHNLVERKEISELNYNNALQKVARLYQKEPVDFKQLIYAEVLSGLKIEDIPEFIVRFAEADADSLSIQEAASFSASLTARARIRQLRDNTPEGLLDNKLAAYQLLDKLELRRPWMMEKRYQWNELPKTESIAIKPFDGAGSRGVYLVFRFDKIQDVKRARLLTSWEQLETSIQADLNSGWVSHDAWLVEELIISSKQDHLPAKDVKFYCFYGKVALILEIDRFPELRYCWWTPDGERIRTGKYDDVLFKGEGISIEDIEDVKSISEQLPLPFIRIDFLKTDQGMVFGEFTPKPGNYETFDKKTDQWLGNYYLDAEGRLAEDLLNGKQFETYKNWVAQLEKEKGLFI